MLLATVPAAATERVEFQPADGTLLEVEDRHHAGMVTVSSHPDGLAVTETLPPDLYLLGLREVPYSWPSAALEAQVIAARTYLAWTLQRGRSANGRRYGYDICATAACQVYSGLEGVLGPGGDRWRRAVEATTGLILFHRGRPAQALYSSTTGGRTRSVEDVFIGSEPLPYLRAVESPGENSPFVSWVFRLDADEMETLLQRAGVLEGSLVDVATRPAADGEGPWMVEIHGSGGVTEVDTWTLRGRLNRAASESMPDRLPARRIDGTGRRYPQTVLSPTYTISRETWWILEDGRAVPVHRYVVAGRGWGHLVGMSQYGAEAMARRGADAEEILAHYYSGLTPAPGGRFLPEQVTVGLAVGREEISVRPEGPVTVVVDGEPEAEEVLGTWTIRFDGQMVVEPPTGLGEPPRFTRPHLSNRGTVRSTLTAPAEVRITVEDRGRTVVDTGWVLREAGPVEEDVTGLEFPTLTFEARSPQGADRVVFRAPGRVR
ncbi:MAG: hypothetical protein KatS3mg011_0921 [Acidimicrobiia bacterium]|nr:MAG: hypothetical protein KatS3mg011_0921 [Acidimicrobiia bacterium]